MNKEEKIGYWVKSSGKDWKVANHLSKKGIMHMHFFLGILRLKNYLKPFL